MMQWYHKRPYDQVTIFSAWFSVVLGISLFYYQLGFLIWLVTCFLLVLRPKMCFGSSVGIQSAGNFNIENVCVVDFIDCVRRYDLFVLDIFKVRIDIIKIVIHQRILVICGKVIRRISTKWLKLLNVKYGLNNITKVYHQYSHSLSSFQRTCERWQIIWMLLTISGMTNSFEFIRSSPRVFSNIAEYVPNIYEGRIVDNCSALKYDCMILSLFHHQSTWYQSSYPLLSSWFARRLVYKIEQNGWL